VQVRNLTETSSDDVSTDGFVAAAIAGGDVDPALLPSEDDAPRKPVVNDVNDWSNTPRNAACPCGSGRKYKVCHGSAA
jgi:hypothetical protein